MRVSEKDQENRECNWCMLMRQKERELVCNLYPLPIHGHHLSQGLMTALNHGILPCDPAIF